ncbi:acyl-CoA N-acyltransferase [Aspergillus heteromorphus CBS 117.55]|uniref:Acyl-CoA N-acyltransferase n=1 Tax=Aspergillus heteromorphus CBS 117.55 TaxID=1448321 RepID=A0A317WZ07_9EURO|nr:acyl-CoA N-acyltransferase [Aspergillus heteromorphus CBS 117.55]PWY89968.1 acyl-CoA N-acyltransferase [Aspergillus heteromorphus CBS 117.55]
MTNPPQPKSTYQILPATTPTHISAIRTLFSAYASWLSIDLTFQDFSTELATLPGKYASPGGALLIAYSVDPSNQHEHEPTPLGCVALRPLPHLPGKRFCEIKRLYVIPEARAMGVGRALAEAVVQTARELGYEEVRLDTLRNMHGPRRLYQALGFVEVGKYYETPVEEETVFLGMGL